MDPLPNLEITLAAPPARVARALLGHSLVSETVDGRVCLRITETEAYAGERDPASHAYGGRTPRNDVMFGPAGMLYVYRSHGVHWCCNVVTGPEGMARAVLLRAGAITAGELLARRRRGRPVDEMLAPRGLASGPGNLTQALGITGSDNGAPLIGGNRLRLVSARTDARPAISRGPRVGVSRAAEVSWRFWITGDPTVSPYRRSARA